MVNDQGHSIQFSELRGVDLPSSYQTKLELLAGFGSHPCRTSYPAKKEAAIQQSCHMLKWTGRH